MKRLVFTCLALLLASCSGGKVQSSVARLRVPAALELKKAYLGEESRTPLLVEAIGTAPVVLAAAAFGDEKVSLEEALPLTIAAGTSVTLDLRWRPDAAGALATTLLLTTDLEDTPAFEIALTGLAAEIPSCDDHNSCTDDAFERESEKCLHRPHERACDDGNACTTGDRCVQGECRGEALRCDDGDVCTRDLCDPAAGCVFPPDTATCDDGDPCTQDVCDRAKGCSHPNADDGTSCGAFSCATAHLCVFGKCRALDVTGASDGLPCFDGDFCTENDTCENGACAPGLRVVGDPKVLSTIDTFGGRGDFVATDGFRFLFADRRSVRIATRDSRGELVVRSRLEVGSTIPPAVVGPGLFVVVQDDSELALVDATAPDAPGLPWKSSISQMLPRFVIRRLWPVGRGLLVDATSRAPANDALFFLPLTGPAHELGAAREILSLPRIVDVDTDGTRVAVLGEGEGRWFQLDAAGNPGGEAFLDVGQLAPSFVSVAGNRVALASLTEAELREVAPAAHEPIPCALGDANCRQLATACDGAFPYPFGWYRSCDGSVGCESGASCHVEHADACPGCGVDCGSACCADADVGVCLRIAEPEEQLVARIPLHAQAQAIALTDVGLLVSTADGLHAYTAPASGDRSGGWNDTVVDRVRPRGLGRSAGNLLVSWGDIALPFELPGFTRITGPGHGDVVAVADGASASLLVAGPLAAGRIDGASMAIRNWRLAPTASGPDQPRALLGATVSSLVDLHATTSSLPPADLSCPGAPLDVVDETLTPHAQPVCRLESAAMELVGRNLYASTALPATPGPTAPGLAWWDITGTSGAPSPFVDHPEHFAVDDLRMASDRRLLLLGHGGPSQMVVQVVTPQGAPAPSDLVFAISGEGVDRWRIAADGRAWLLGDGSGLVLYEDDPSMPVNASVMPGGPARWSIFSMANGRAWAMSLDSNGALGLSEFAYDAQQPSTLEQRGSVAPLDEPLSRVFDFGPFAVATSPHAIRLLRPACR